jgi:hypothetical protein
MSSLRAAGQPANLADYRKALPLDDPSRLAALNKAIDVLLSFPYHSEVVDRMPLRLRDVPLPWPHTDADRAAIDLAHRIITSTALLDDPTLPSLNSHRIHRG